jgi:tricorn protease-like protein
MGTVGYMSPEQAQGKTKEIDQRSDIFSFGCILFEAATGKKPFAGDSVVKSLHMVIYEPAPPISELNPSAPADLQRIIRRCLVKDADERYQSIKEVAIELKGLRRELEGVGVDTTVPPPSTMSTAAPSTSRASAENAAITSLPSGVAPTPPSSAEYIVTQIKQHKKGALVGLALLALLVAGLAFGIYKWVSRKQPTSFESMKITKLTDTGKAGEAAISPDGKYVVHVKEDGGQQSLWVVHIATGSNVQIIAPAEVNYGRMKFSPDGSYVYFIRREKNETNPALYQVPVLGGEPKKLNSHVDSPVTFSPDVKRIAFVRSQRADSLMMIANPDGTGEQTLARRIRPESFKTHGPAWSPDGKVIVTSAVDVDEGGRTYQTFVEVRADDGSVKPFGSQKWADTGQVSWLADGSGFIATGAEPGSTNGQVYQISYPGGEVRKITNDLLSYYGNSMTADSGSILTVQKESTLNIWSAPDGDTGRAQQLTRGALKSEGAYGLQGTPRRKDSLLVVGEYLPEPLDHEWRWRQSATIDK